MEMQNCNSSTIKAYGYDAASKVLSVEFTSGGKYNYYNVPEIVYQGLENAPSKGQYIHKNVLKFFSYSKVN